MSDFGLLLAEVRTLSESSENDEVFTSDQPSKQKSVPKKRRQPDESLVSSNSEVVQLLLQQNQTLMRIVEER